MEKEIKAVDKYIKALMKEKDKIGSEYDKRIKEGHNILKILKEMDKSLKMGEIHDRFRLMDCDLWYKRRYTRFFK